jgi:hypothetical protein
MLNFIFNVIIKIFTFIKDIVFSILKFIKWAIEIMLKEILRQFAKIVFVIILGAFTYYFYH